MICSHLALQGASYLIAEKLRKGPCASLSYQTTKGRNIPPKRTRIHIWAKNFPNQQNWLGIHPSQSSFPICSSLLCLSGTLKCFLHACTPERRTRALAHLFNQREHGQSPRTQHISFKKNVQIPETLGNDSSGAASEPHRFKYILVGCSLSVELAGQKKKGGSCHGCLV